MTLTKPFRVVFDADGRVITELRNVTGETRTEHPCAEFDTETELDAFILTNGLWWNESQP